MFLLSRVSSGPELSCDGYCRRRNQRQELLMNCSPLLSFFESQRNGQFYCDEKIELSNATPDLLVLNNTVAMKPFRLTPWHL
mmetsp:Transcript_20708/g.43343  ORF Transcript_20708/g.43343 Transcript_20708/m.43343 type:complete len:82 (-) Transcript_20708:11-256(-)